MKKSITMLLCIMFASFAPMALAGQFGTGSFSQKTVSHGNSTITGTAINLQNGSGMSGMGELLNGRLETYTRADSTITTFDGESRTHKITKTSGSNSGISGSSVSMTKGTTRGSMDSVATINDLVSGTYNQFTYDANGFNSESGTFSESYAGTNVGYESYKTDFKANSASAYPSY